MIGDPTLLGVSDEPWDPDEDRDPDSSCEEADLPAEERPLDD